MQIFVAIVLIVITIIVLVQVFGGAQKADVTVTVKSRRTLEKYDAIVFLEKTVKNLRKQKMSSKKKRDPMKELI